MFSTEAEDIVAARCYAIILWIKSQLADYDIIYEKLPITIQFCTKKTKLSNIKSRIILSNETMNSFHPTQYQLADIFTKPLDEPTFKRLFIELGTKPRAKPGHKKHSSSKQPSVSSKEATKGGSSKAPTGSKTGHSKKRKESSSAMDSNPSQPPVSTPVDTRMHKEDQKATVAQHFRALRNDASAASTAEADPGNSAPSDFVPQQQGMNEGTKNTSYDHLFAGTDPHVLADQTKSVSEGLETVLTQPITGKGASSVARQIKEETSSTIKLEDLAKLVSHVQPSFKDLDSPEDDPVIVVDDSDEDEDDEVHATENVETEDTSVPKSSSPRSSQIQELTTILISSCPKAQTRTREKKAEAKAALLKLNPPFPMWNNSKSCWRFERNFRSKLEEYVQRLSQVLSSQGAELKPLKYLATNVTKAMNNYCSGFRFCLTKVRDKSVSFSKPSYTKPAEKEKNTNQATSPQLFQRQAKKNAEKKPKQPTTYHLFQQSLRTTTPCNLLPLQSTRKLPLNQGGATQMNKGKRFDFVTEDGEHVHLTKEQINQQKKIEEEAKAEAARREGEIRKEELIDLLGPEVVNNSVPFSLSVDLNIKYLKSSLVEDSSASVLQALRRSSGIFTPVYVAV
ncbi:hypothetical protein Tco_0573167 [Tanacetum coccineum]